MPEKHPITSSQPSPRLKYSDGLQVLRGLAALLIVFIHLGVAESRYGSLLGFRFLDGFRIGTAGVDIFFVISGFVMVLVTRNRNVDSKTFLLNRLSRIYPNYWIYYFLILGTWLIQPAWVNSSMVGEPAFLSSFVLLPSQGVPVVSVAWTLEFELYFYFMFALTLWISRKNQVVLLVFSMLTLVVMGGIFRPTHFTLDRLTHPLILEFASGVMLGYLLLKKSFRWGWLMLPLGILILIFHQIGLEVTQLIGGNSHFERVINFGIPAGLMVFGVVNLDIRSNPRYPKLLTDLGDASYTLYLSHILVIAAVGRMWQWLSLQTVLPNWIFILVQLLAVIIYSILAYRFIELPLLTFVRRRLKKPLK